MTGGALSPASLASGPSRKLDPWVPFAAALLAGVLYLNSLGNGFTFDDFRTVVGNACVSGETPLFDSLSRDVWCLPATHSTGSWRPVTLLWLRAVYALAGLSSFGFHLQSLLLYVLAGGLAAALARRVLGDPKAALGAALLFVLHPVHTEAVDSISATGDLLSSALLFAGLLLWTGPDRAGRRAGALALFSLAVLAKETALVALPLAFLWDLLTRRFRWGWSGLPLAWIGLYVVVKILAFGPLGASIRAEDTPLADADGATYLPTALTALFTYLRLLLFPLSLSIDYGFNVLPLTDAWTDPRVIGPLLFLVAGSAGMVLAGRRAPALAFGLGFLLGGLALPSNLLLPLPTLVAERLALLPSFGLALLVGDGGSRLLAAVSPPRRIWVIVPCAVLLFALGFRTLIRNADWHSNLSLFASAVETTPESRKARLNYGWFLRGNGRYAEALVQLEAAQALDPEWDDPILNQEIGICLHGLGRMDEALVRYRKALRRAPRAESLKHLIESAEARAIPPWLIDVGSPD